MKADLKTMLQSKGITQNQIARATGWSQSEIYKSVNGLRIMPDNVAQKIAEMLDLTPDDVKESVKLVVSPPVKRVKKDTRQNSKGHSARLSEIEFNEGLMGINSEAYGLYYLLDKNTPHIPSRKLTILSIYEGKEMKLKLDLKMAKALIEEIKDICEMQWEGYI